MNRKTLIVFLISIFILNGLALLIFPFSKTVEAQTCAAISAVTGVKVEYPGCQGTQCDSNQASCSWTTSSDAVSYNITVTELETGLILKNNESTPSGTTKVLFPITQQRTYKCDVVAISSCGSLSPISSDQLLCGTATLTPTKIPTPTIADPGGIGQTFVILSAAIAVIIGGIFLFAL